MSEKSQKILEYLRQIPKGKVMSYKGLGDIFGMHARGVSMVMKHNKYPEKFPCYKIVSHSRKIGGYSGNKGIDGKISLLKNDGVQIRGGKIPVEYFYKP